MANKIQSLLGVAFLLAGSAAAVACSSSSSDGGSTAGAGGSGTGAGGSSASAGSTGAVSLTEIRMTTMHVSCAISASCHSGATAAGFIDFSDARTNAQIIGDLKKQSTDDPATTIAVPGDPESSLLYHKLTQDFGSLPCVKSQTCGTPMPQTGPKLPDAQIAEIKAWIAAGMLDD